MNLDDAQQHLINKSLTKKDAWNRKQKVVKDNPVYVDAGRDADRMAKVSHMTRKKWKLEKVQDRER